MIRQSTWTSEPCQTIQQTSAQKELGYITTPPGSVWQPIIVENTWTYWIRIRIYYDQRKILVQTHTRQNNTSERLHNQHSSALDEYRQTNYNSLRRNLTRCYTMVLSDSHHFENWPQWLGKSQMLNVNPLCSFFVEISPLYNIWTSGMITKYRQAAILYISRLLFRLFITLLHTKDLRPKHHMVSEVGWKQK